MKIKKSKMAVALFSLLISFVALWFGFKLVKSYITVKNWDKTEATVLSKKVAKHERSSTKGLYGVKVDYTYIFNNQKYTNNKVYLVELSGGQVNQYQSNAQEIVDKLQDKIMVYVNPDHPEQSVIFCEGILLYGFVIIMGLFAFLYGTVTLLTPYL
jgi:hypothetical protein